jgi:hypothetical protein
MLKGSFVFSGWLLYGYQPSWRRKKDICMWMEVYSSDQDRMVARIWRRPRRQAYGRSGTSSVNCYNYLSHHSHHCRCLAVSTSIASREATAGYSAARQLMNCRACLAALPELVSALTPPAVRVIEHCEAAKKFSRGNFDCSRSGNATNVGLPALGLTARPAWLTTRSFE